MDFGLREILFLIGLVFIVGILFDGLRRMRKSKGELFGLPPDYDQIETGRNSPDIPERDQVNNGSEVIDLRATSEEPLSVHRTAPMEGPEGVAAEYNDELPNGGARPVLYSAASEVEEQQRVEPEMGALLTESHREEALYENRPPFLHDIDPEEEAVSESELAVSSEVEDVIIFNIVAKNKSTFSGQALAKAVEMCHLELGEMNIFHRYEASGNPSDPKEKIFSLANLVEPGTFDLDTLHDFKSPGVCLFMQLPGPSRSIAALERMVDTARKLAIKLGAEMRDEHHSVITPQTIEHYRQRVMEFERKRRTRRHAELSY